MTVGMQLDYHKISMISVYSWPSNICLGFLKNVCIVYILKLVLMKPTYDKSMLKGIKCTAISQLAFLIPKK